MEALTTRTGVTATLSHGATPGARVEVLRVTDAQGRLLFEHNAATGTTVIVAPEGDLELRAPAGKVRISAAEGLELEAGAVRARVGDVTVEGRSLTATFDRVRQVVGVLETRAERVLERAKNVFREVEELSQTRAGRLRLVAEKAVHVMGQRALIKAKEDVKVKGDKVYLA